MGQFFSAAAVILGFGIFGNAYGQAQPNTFTFGTIAGGSVSNATVTCANLTGASQFNMAPGGTQALMSFPEVDYIKASSGKQDTAAGVATLSFASATAGKIVFDDFLGTLSPLPKLTFSNFTEAYNGVTGLLSVSFYLNFGRACALSISAVYHTPG